MKEEDIRPADLFQKYLDMSAADAKTYFNSSARKVIPCPACGSENAHDAFEKWGFKYVTCDICSTLYQSPRPPRHDFSLFYQDSPSSYYWAKTFFPAVAEARREKLFKPKAREIADLCKKDKFYPQIVADIGAGYGLLLEEWRKIFPDNRTVAIEPNPEMADICRAKKLEVHECFAEDASEIIGQIELVVALEVIEHVHNPLLFVESLKNLMKKGSRLLLTGLTIDGFDIQVLWEKSKSISPPHHINFMSVKGFECLLKRAGFVNVEVFTPGKLDVDIVRNVFKENPNVLSDQRFIRTLFSKQEPAINAFQKYLADNQLSSHCWVWAEK